MQCYVIKSKLTGFALEPEGGGFKPNSKVTPQDFAPGKASQIWYDDNSSGTIRNKASNFCLDIEDECLVVRPFQQGDPNQQWTRQGAFIRNRCDQNRVLDIYGENKDRGAKIGVYGHNGNKNQQWDFEFVTGEAQSGGGVHQQQAQPGGYPGGYPQQTTSQQGGYPGYPAYPSQGGGYPSQGGGYPSYPTQGGGYPSYPSQGGGYPAQGGSGFPTHQAKREFFIVSEMHGKVIDVQGGQVEPGAKALMWEKHETPSKNQLWYVDSTGCIKSSLNDLPFGNSEKGEVLTMQPTGGPRTQWFFEGNKILNREGECLDIRGEKTKNGAELVSYDFKDQANQKWKQEFI